MKQALKNRQAGRALAGNVFPENQKRNPKAAHFSAPVLSFLLAGLSTEEFTARRARCQAAAKRSV
jgi:hypothetical protein